MKRWTFKTGDHGNSVVVFEREAGGLLYARAWDRSLAEGKGGWRRVSLKHRDRDAAKEYARDQVAKLREGSADLVGGRVTWATVFALYQQHRTPQKSAGEQQGDKRRVEMWTRVLGGTTDPLAISVGQWEEFMRNRRSGAIDAYANPVAEDERVPVRGRSVEEDCLWLRWVLNWAARWKQNGRKLVRENPLRDNEGFEVPKEQNPRRPLATSDRYEAIRAVSDKVTMTVRGNGKRHVVRSYVSEVLDIAHDTGRRVSAILGLRYQDLRLVKTKQAPHGAIQWPGETDKMGKAWSAPITARVRAALDRVVKERPGIGPACVFPSPANPERPVDRYLASKWLRRAEVLAEVPKHDGSLWHAYRRTWATARKHLPDVDVAAAGGWKSTETLKRCYQQPDADTMLAVVLGGAELREKQA